MMAMLSKNCEVPREQIEVLAKGVLPKTTTIETWWPTLSVEDKKCIIAFQKDFACRLCLLHTFEDLFDWLSETGKSTCLTVVNAVDNHEERLRKQQVIVATFLQARLPDKGLQLLPRYVDTLNCIVSKSADDHIKANNEKMYSWWCSLPNEHKMYVLKNSTEFVHTMCIVLKEDLKTFMDWLDIPEAAQGLLLEQAGPTIKDGGNMYHWFDLFFRVWTMKKCLL